MGIEYIHDGEEDPFADVRDTIKVERGHAPAIQQVEPGLKVTTIDVPANMTKERGFAAFLQQVSFTDGVIVFRPEGEGIWESQEYLAKAECYAEIYELLEHRREHMSIICVSTGRTRGLSMMLPAMSTISLATPDATFGFPEVKVGGIPAMAAHMLKKRVDLVTQNRLCTLGDIVDAQEAQRIGLVDYVGDVDTELARLLYQRGASQEVTIMYKPDVVKALEEQHEDEE